MTLKVDKKAETARVGSCTILGNKIPFPAYIPEIKSVEDWGVFVHTIGLIPENNPVMLPSGHWAVLASSLSTTTLDFDLNIALAIKKRHIIFYEPMEIYSFKLPHNLFVHSTHYNDSTRRLFWKYVLELNDPEKALLLLPPFERSFVKTLWKYITDLHPRNLESVKGKNEPTSAYRRVLEKTWLSIDEEYIAKITGMMYEAPKIGSVSFVPPVPLLRSTSTPEMVSQVRRMNRAAAFLFIKKPNSVLDLKLAESNSAAPWLSLYVDSSCFEVGSEDDGKVGIDTISKLIRTSFDSRAHVGIAITINGMDRLKKDQTEKNRLLNFIENIDEFAISQGVPILIPRSGYYGMELLDYGIEFFSSLLSGAFRYSSGGGQIDPEDKFGKTVVYRVGELTLDRLRTYLATNGELPLLDGLPSVPSEYLLSHDNEFRKMFSKPRRIATHIREAKEISDAIKRGTIRPATEYLTEMNAEGGKNYT